MARRWPASILAASALAALLPLGQFLAGCARNDPAPSAQATPPAAGARPTGQAAQATVGDKPDLPALSFFALGDTGYGGTVLDAIARAMDVSALERPVAFAMLLGDNFYPAGVRSLDDERWKTIFEDPFAREGLEIPFYAVLGNHDHRGLPEVQVEYTEKSERWRMPARWYTFTQPMPGGITAQFFALDTEPIEEEWESGAFQVTWLENELSRSTARWKVVFGHHPMLSHGRHGGTEEMVNAFASMFQRQGVDLYVSGHDHDLQVLASPAGWLQIVSGAGSSTRRVGRGDDTLYAASKPGYTRVSFGPRTMWVEVSTVERGVEFRWEVEKD